MSVYAGGYKLATSNEIEHFNLLTGSKGPFIPNRGATDNYVEYDNTLIYLEQGETYTVFANTNKSFGHNHPGGSNQMTLWCIPTAEVGIDADNGMIISDSTTSTTGTTFIWNYKTGHYHLRVNAYVNDTSGEVWNVKIVKGSSISPDWLPSLDEFAMKSDIDALQKQINELKDK